MNEPHENLDPDPFAHDASRRPSRLRRTVVRRARLGARGACALREGLFSAPAQSRRQSRPCPRADRGPLR
jgi:hypothetical protein